jgi:hypothetical protein
MAVKFMEIRIRGRQTRVPCVEIEGRTVVAVGKHVKVASVFDDDVMEGEMVKDPKTFVAELKRSGLKADVLTFFQRVPDTTPKFPFHHTTDNYAVVPITTFEAWWDALPQESRKNARRAAKRGVEVKVSTFDDELVRGIKKIFDESPVRQGRRFWHFGKDHATVKMEQGTYLERSEFIGAYFEGELIGIVKFVYVDKLAYLLTIIGMNAHWDKRPMNAMLAKAIEVCAQKKAGYFVYGNYIYGKKSDSSLVEFKRRNGFVQADFPRYYVPLTLKGKIYVALRMYRGLSGSLPAPMLSAAWRVREFLYRFKKAPAKESPAKQEKES